MAISRSAISSEAQLPVRHSDHAKGERYVDEGANFTAIPIAKYGGEIIKLPGMFCLAGVRTPR